METLCVPEDLDNRFLPKFYCGHCDGAGRLGTPEMLRGLEYPFERTETVLKTTEEQI
jgi:hypothetical protein